MNALKAPSYTDNVRQELRALADLGDRSAARALRKIEAKNSLVIDAIIDAAKSSMSVSDCASLLMELS